MLCLCDLLREAFSKDYLSVLNVCATLDCDALGCNASGRAMLSCNMLSCNVLSCAMLSCNVLGSQSCCGKAS